MTTDVQTPRISEQSENYEAVFHRSMETAKAVADGALEVQEATATARNLGNAVKTLDSDLKSRLVEHRLRARTVNKQVEGPQSPTAK